MNGFSVGGLNFTPALWKIPYMDVHVAAAVEGVAKK